MKTEEEINYTLERFKENCAMEYKCYTRGEHIIFLDGEVKGNKHLFAFRAFMFCIGYLREYDGKQSSSVNKMLRQWAYDALGRLVKDKVKQNDNQENDTE